MESTGLEIVSVIDEANLYRELKAGPPELFILDFQLPGTSGIEVAQRLLALRIETPILFLSEFTSQYPVDYQIDPRGRFSVIFKPVEDFLAWGLETFDPTVQELMGLESSVRGALSDVSPDQLPLWNYSPAELDELETRPSPRVSEETAGKLSGTAARVFEFSSAEWVIVVLVDGVLRIVGWGALRDSPPTSDALRKLEGEHKAAALVITRPVRVEMVDSEGYFGRYAALCATLTTARVTVFPPLT